jgi:hypothetical protein
MSLFKTARQMGELQKQLQKDGTTVYDLLRHMDSMILTIQKNQVEIGKRLHAIEKKLGITDSDVEAIDVVEYEYTKVQKVE